MSTNSKLVLGCLASGILGLLIVIGLIVALQSGTPNRPVAQQSQPPPDQASTGGVAQPTAPPKHGGHEPIGVSYAAVMDGLTDAFQMEKVVPVDGYDHFVGKSSFDGRLIQEIIGDKSNISSTTLVCVVSKNDDALPMLQHSALLTLFMRNLVPEWPGSIDWINAALLRAAKTGRESSTVRGIKLIKVSPYKTIGTVANCRAACPVVQRSSNTLLGHYRSPESRIIASKRGS